MFEIVAEHEAAATEWAVLDGGTIHSLVCVFATRGPSPQAKQQGISMKGKLYELLCAFDVRDYRLKTGRKTVRATGISARRTAWAALSLSTDRADGRYSPHDGYGLHYGAPEARVYTNDPLLEPESRFIGNPAPVFTFSSQGEGA